jgi:hypothetical protein
MKGGMQGTKDELTEKTEKRRRRRKMVARDGAAMAHSGITSKKPKQTLTKEGD